MTLAGHRLFLGPEKSRIHLTNYSGFYYYPLAVLSGAHAPISGQVPRMLQGRSGPGHQRRRQVEDRVVRRPLQCRLKLAGVQRRGQLLLLVLPRRF
jgi:hypothetical protein